MSWRIKSLDIFYRCKRVLSLAFIVSISDRDRRFGFGVIKIYDTPNGINNEKIKNTNGGGRDIFECCVLFFFFHFAK